MSIYDDNKFGFPTVKFPPMPLKYLALAIISLIIVFAALSILSEFLRPKQLYFSLNPNPLDLTKPGEGSSLLEVSVFNTKNETISDVVVKVEEIGSSRLIIFPDQRKIDAMAPGTEQQMDSFIIRPNPNKEINSGSYRIRVSLSIEGEKAEEEDLMLIIKAV